MYATVSNFQTALIKNYIPILNLRAKDQCPDSCHGTWKNPLSPKINRPPHPAASSTNDVSNLDTPN